MGTFITCLFIFIAKVLEISLDTLRLNFLVKGKKILMVLIGFIEVVIWITIVSQVLKGEITIWVVIAYAGGYAIGNLLGSIIEEKIAIGNVTIEVIINSIDDNLPNLLRDEGFGVSQLECRGRDSKHSLLIIVANRKDLKRVKQKITEFDKDVFITVLDTKSVLNGYFK